MTALKGERRIYPSAYHAEMLAQAAAFCIFGVKPTHVDLQLVLLSVNATFSHRLPAGGKTENFIQLVSSKGNEAKGYMNFFECSTKVGGVEVSKIRFNAMASYIPKVSH